MAQFSIMNSARHIQVKSHFILKVFIVVCLCFVLYAGIANNFTISTSNVHNDKFQFVNPNLQNDNDQVQFVNRKLQNDNDQVRNLLDGCYHVYIDVGTNVGIQIRKLFEPEKYPDANVHKVFDTKFGNIKERLRPTIDGGSTICAIGFEPNSHHTEQLVKIESAYQQCGWRVVIFTESAASDRNGVGKFYTDEAYGSMEWGGGVLPPDINNIAHEKQKDDTKPKFKDVTLIRLSEFLMNVVGTRRIPMVRNRSNPPQIVMKMDIEGSEVDVIPDMLFTGGFQYINTIMVEWHERLEKTEERKKAQNQLQSIVKTLSSYSETMKDSGAKFSFIEIDVDDESYYTSKFDFPSCSSIT